MPGLLDILFGGGQPYWRTPGINPDAPPMAPGEAGPMGLYDPIAAEEFKRRAAGLGTLAAGATDIASKETGLPLSSPLGTGAAGQGPESPGFFGRIASAGSSALENPLTHVGLGLLSTGQWGPGIGQGLMSYGQSQDRKARSDLLRLQQQQVAGALQEQQRKRMQAQAYRATLPADSPLRNLPDEELLKAAATLATQKPPEESYGQPVEVIGPDGKPQLVQFGNRGAMRPVTGGMAPKPPTDQTLVAIPDETSPTGFRYVPRSQAAGQPAMGPNGLALETDPATGRLTGLRFGAGAGAGKPTNPAGLAAPTINALEEQSLNAGNALARLDQINRSYRPEYQQITTRGANWWNATREKLGADLSEQDRTALTEFSQFRRDSVQVLNQTIKDITGAAMTNAEAGRIQNQVPNPGTGLFDGDSPTEFKAKLDGVTKDTRNALLRANWARTKGLDPLKTGVELSEVPALIEKRGAEIEADIRAKSPNLDEQSIRQLLRTRLGREFGMLQ